MPPPFRLAEFISSADAGVRADVERVPPLPAAFDACLVSGPPRSGKTSLLFHFAHAVACAGGSVVFFTTRAAAEAAPPLLPEGVARGDPAWARVQMKRANSAGGGERPTVGVRTYVSCAADVAAYAACAHLLPAPADAYVVDGLGELAALDGVGRRLADRRAGQKAAAACLAALADAAAGSWRGGRRARVVVADAAAPDGGPADAFLVRRWLPLVLSIRPASPAGYDLGALPSAPHDPPLPAACCTRVRYRIAGRTALAADAVVGGVDAAG